MPLKDFAYHMLLRRAFRSFGIRTAQGKLLVFIIAWLGLAIAIQVPTAAALTNKQILKNFELFTVGPRGIGKTTSNGDSSSNQVVKWTTPVRIRIDYHPGGRGYVTKQQFADLVSRQTEVLQKAVGHNLQFTTVAGTKANFVFFFISREGAIDRVRTMGPRNFGHYKRLFYRFNCVYLIARRTDGSVLAVESYIFKNKNKSKRTVNHCILSQLLKILGLVGNSEELFPHTAVVRTKNRPIAPTEVDLYSMKILYDPRIRPGMRKPEAMSAAARILEEMRPGR